MNTSDADGLLAVLPPNPAGCEGDNRDEGLGAFWTGMSLLGHSCLCLVVGG